MTGNELYGRFCRVTVLSGSQGRQLTAPPLTIEFDVEFGANRKPNMSTIRIYNPAQETIAAASIVRDKNGRKVKPIPRVLVEAGYGLNIGQAIVGEVFSSRVIWQKPDIVLELKCTDATTEWREAWISKTYGKFATASEIIFDMLGSVGLTPYAVKLGENPLFAQEQSFNESLVSAMTRLAKATKSEFYFRGGRLVFKPIGSDEHITLVLLNPETGLIGSPEPTDRGYKFQSLFNHQIGAGDKVAVQSRDVSGNFLVLKGKHVWQESKATTEFEARKVAA